MTPAHGHGARDYSAQAEQWIAAHPRAFELFLRFARERADRGKAFGGKALAERVRWEHADTLAPGEGELALNNNHVAYIVRAMLRREPRLARFCSLREVDSTEEVPHAVAVAPVASTPASASSHAARIDTRAPAPAHTAAGACAGETREPAGSQVERSAHGKSGGTLTDRRAENPRQQQTAPVPGAARSSPGTLFDSAPAPKRWRA